MFFTSHCKTICKRIIFFILFLLSSRTKSVYITNKKRLLILPIQSSFHIAKGQLGKEEIKALLQLNQLDASFLAFHLTELKTDTKDKDVLKKRYTEKKENTMRQTKEEYIINNWNRETNRMYKEIEKVRLFVTSGKSREREIQRN